MARPPLVTSVTSFSHQLLPAANQVLKSAACQVPARQVPEPDSGAGARSPQLTRRGQAGHPYPVSTVSCTLSQVPARSRPCNTCPGADLCPRARCLQPAAGASPPLHISNQPDADGRHKVFPWEILSPGNCGRMGTRFYIWVFLGNFATPLYKYGQKVFPEQFFHQDSIDVRMGKSILPGKIYQQETIQKWAQCLSQKNHFIRTQSKDGHKVF